jgi:hypothetical protein
MRRIAEAKPEASIAGLLSASLLMVSAQMAGTAGRSWKREQLSRVVWKRPYDPWVQPILAAPYRRPVQRARDVLLMPPGDDLPFKAMWRTRAASRTPPGDRGGTTRGRAIAASASKPTSRTRRRGNTHQHPDLARHIVLGRIAQGRGDTRSGGRRVRAGGGRAGPARSGATHWYYQCANPGCGAGDAGGPRGAETFRQASCIPPQRLGAYGLKEVYERMDKPQASPRSRNASIGRFGERETLDLRL